MDVTTAQLLREEPLEAVRELFDLTVEVADWQGASPCSVSGRYYGDQLRIVVDGRSAAQRQNFTVLHELGHHVTYDVEDVANLIESFEDPDEAEAAEEDFADAFAACLLLPSELVDLHIGTEGPTPDAVIGLVEGSTASREACAVAAVQRIDRSGYVVVSDLAGTVRFAARSNTPYRIARDTRQPPDGVLAQAANSGRASDPRATLRYASGQPTDPHHAQAVRHGNYVIAVFTTGRPPWDRGLWIPDESVAQATQATCGFDDCGHEWTALGRPCSRCRDHRCEECGRCGCDVPETAEVAICQCGCGMQVRASRVVGGVCNDCR
jgi:hypothetical protein